MNQVLNTAGSPADDLNARLLANMDEHEKQSSSFQRFAGFKSAGDTVVRFLPSKNWPNDIVWYRQFGRHSFKPAGAAKTFMFPCLAHAYGTNCPLCEAQRRDKDSADPELAELADAAYASKRYILNGQIYDMATRQFGPVIPFELSKTQFDELKPVLRMVNPRFVDPEFGHILHIRATPRQQGKGFDIKVIKAEGPHNSGITADLLYDLDEIVKQEFAHLKSAANFTGNFKAPLPGILPDNNGLMSLGAPAAMANILGAPAAAPLSIMQAPVTVMQNITPTVAVAAAAPVMATVSLEPVAVAVAAPVVAATVMQPAPLTVNVAPAVVAPNTAQVDDLEAKLLALVK